MKIAVTGAAGQVGSHVMEELIPDHEVVGIDLKGPSIKEHAPLIRRADVRDPAAVATALEGVEAVIHLAAQISVPKSISDPLFDLDVNVKGTLSMLHASKNAGVRRFVFVSSAAVYGDPLRLPLEEEHPKNPLSFYGVSKVCGEEYVKAFGRTMGLEYAIVRPFNLYSVRADPSSPYSGVITKFVTRAKEGKDLLVEGDGLQTRDFAHVRDLARMISLILRSDAKDITLNCGSGRGTSVLELARTVQALSPQKVGIVHKEARLGDIRHSVADVTRAKELLKFETEIDLRDGLATFFEL